MGDKGAFDRSTVVFNNASAVSASGDAGGTSSCLEHKEMGRVVVAAMVRVVAAR